MRAASFFHPALLDFIILSVLSEGSELILIYSAEEKRDVGRPRKRWREIRDWKRPGDWAMKWGIRTN
jgi:hypothetical protein